MVTFHYYPIIGKIMKSVIILTNKYFGKTHQYKVHRNNYFKLLKIEFKLYFKKINIHVLMSLYNNNYC